MHVGFAQYINVHLIPSDPFRTFMPKDKAVMIQRDPDAFTSSLQAGLNIERQIKMV